MIRITKICFLLLFFTSLMFSQTSNWTYKGEIKFPDSDTGKVAPYLLSVDDNGRVWVVSSKVLTTKAINGVFYADSNDTELTKFIDYDLNGDSDTLNGFVGQIRGINTIGDQVFITNSIPFKHFNNTLASLYRYYNSDTNSVEKFGSNLQGAGYGTYIHGAALTKDTILITGITFNTSFRMYSFNRTITTPGYGSWVAMPGNYPLEPGGAHTNGFDVIRDVATVPNGDYTSPETPFYSSRNSLESTNITGGIAVWTGGDQSNPANYTGVRLFDAASDLVFDKNFPYGITVDKDKRLWVCGTDSTRKWVKAYSVTINFAEKVAELPSSTNPNNPDTLGAPFSFPSDVALSNDGLTAYVADYGMNTIFKFKYEEPNSVNENEISLNDFRLNQNYPNPFNPSTIISYSLPKASNVKLTITNALGQIVETLVNSFESEGTHSASFNAKNLSSGIYFYTLTTEAGSISKKMSLIK